MFESCRAHGKKSCKPGPVTKVTATPEGGGDPVTLTDAVTANFN